MLDIYQIGYNDGYDQWAPDPDYNEDEEYEIGYSDGAREYEEDEERTSELNESEDSIWDA